MNIPIGHKNAIRAPKEGNRWFRQSIEELNNNGDFIINLGDGYFRPDPTDKLDVLMFNQYIRQEIARARSCLSKAEKMKEAFDGEVCER